MKIKYFVLAGIALCISLNILQAQVAALAWQQTGAPLATWHDIACSSDGTRLIAVGDGPARPVYLSTNSGATWTPSSLSVQVYPYGGHEVASSSDGKTLAVLDEGTVYISADSGATWTARQTTDNYWSGIAMSADGTKMVAVDQVAGSSGGEIYTSSDSGTNWTLRSSGQFWQDVASSADGTKLIAVSSSTYEETPGGIYISTDSGTTWTQNTGFNYLWTSVACSADGTKLFATEVSSLNHDVEMGFGIIHFSTDAGSHWDTSSFPQGSPWMTWINVACSTNGNLVVAAGARSYIVGVGGTYPGVIYTSTNSGAAWQLAYAPDMNWRGVASSADGTKLYGAGHLLANNDSAPIYTYTMPSTNAPVMNIASGGGNAFISWPWPSSDFVLQQNTNLASTNWVTVSNVTAVVNQAIVPQTNANNFYRLMQP